MNGGTVLTRFTSDTKGFDKGTQKVTASIGSLVKGTVVAKGVTAALTKAWEVFNSSLDGAISRYDTLNNFPKVMENLGVSTKESEKAISKISDKLTKLPTTLDSAAISVQRLTSKNGDLKKSTDMFLAMNNAILAGGAPMEMQQSALEQLTQSYAKGKPDLMEWRTLQQAMPGQLKQIARSMGYVSDSDLYEALKDGSVSMEDFMDTVIKLNTEGADGFKSFEKQAEDATGGIRTSITNMKTAFVRGVTDIITKVNEALEPVGGLAGVFSTVGSAVEKAFKLVGSALETVIPVLISVFTWLNKHRTVLKVTAVAVGTFLAAWKVTQMMAFIQMSGGVINALLLMRKAWLLLTIAKIKDRIETIRITAMYAKDFVVSIVKGTAALVKQTAVFVATKGAMVATSIATKVATAAQWLLNAALTANPIGIIIMLIGLLIGAFIMLALHSDKVRAVLVKCWEGIKVAVKVTWDFLKSTFNKIVDWFKSIPERFTAWVNKVKAIFKLIVIMIALKFLEIVNKVQAFRQKVLDFIKNIINGFKSLPGKIKSALLSVLTAIGTWIINMKNKVSNGISKVITNIKNGFKQLPSYMLNIGKNIVQGLWNGIQRVKDWVIDKIKGLGKAIISGMKKALGIKSPSKEFAIIGKFSVLGYTEQLDKMKKTVQSQIADTFQVSPQLANSSSLNLSPNIVNNTYVEVKQDALGQTVKNIKTFSGGAKNDFNYGMGAR